jgi:hypothetical protein
MKILFRVITIHFHSKHLYNNHNNLVKINYFRGFHAFITEHNNYATQEKL